MQHWYQITSVHQLQDIAAGCIACIETQAWAKKFSANMNAMDHTLTVLLAIWRHCKNSQKHDELSFFGTIMKEV